MDDRRGSAHRVSRRGLLAAAGAAGLAAGAAGGSAAGRGERHADASTARRPADTVVPAYGRHQAGVVTPQQRQLQLAAFDVDAADVADVRDLLQAWTTAAADLSRGRPASAPAGHADWADSGEADGLGPARLTVTIGLGPSLFERDGVDRFGLRSRRPPELRPLPAFAGDALEQGSSDGDLCVQICADDPQVTFHALHTLTRMAHGAARVRWVQEGFLGTNGRDTPRNVLGFRDGTRNLAPTEPADAARLWVGDGWMRDGTYLVMRRVRTVLDVWDVTSVAEQERVIGRHKASGAPLGARDELAAFDPHGLPRGAHVREASPEANGGAKIQRRGYAFSDGLDRDTGQLDAGLVFISFQRDPEQFVRIQRRLAEHDALNKHVLHTAGAVFAVPPGARPGGSVGDALFAG